MAIDVALRRFSATGLLLPFRGGGYPGTAGIVGAERQAVSWIYSGISTFIELSSGRIAVALTSRGPAIAFTPRAPGVALTSITPDITFTTP